MDAFASMFLERKIYLWMDIFLLLQCFLPFWNRMIVPLNELGIPLPKVALRQVWLKLADMDRRQTAPFSLGELNSEHRTRVIVAYMT